MSNDNKNGSFDLLAHEKKLSELYQNDKKRQGEAPSAQIDSDIMAMAKRQLSENSQLLDKEQTLNLEASANTNKKRNSKNLWQWPFSLVASVGILGLLFITQRDYFIHPTNIVAGDAGILNEPVSLVPDISQSAEEKKAITSGSSFDAMPMTASTHKAEVLLNEESALVASKRMSISKTPKVLNEQIKEQMLDRSQLEVNSAKIAAMSLPDMSKLAELLRQQLSKQNMSELGSSASSIKMQQSLFEHLAQYQKSHKDFKIPEKYLNVLTEEQVEQLQSMASKADSNN
ncbi:hypothetical protein [Paraglaciecola arctica]|uniref:Uncharacterized protein n=1 Tax=Paraglaciecola arctica BSs20135 TaxID=493475 RepID=K6YN08_9ALTE|nr:hypothetical protein [Paraglaciecola arctica]GAC19572.1 hypothetical protein GARC_2606 [Paraglaciecola arctica BSs20135]